MQRVLAGAALAVALLCGTSPVLVAAERGLIFQSGLLEVSPHPNFAQNRLLYVTYAHGTQADNRLRLARATFDGQRLSNLQVRFEVSQGKPEFQRYGGRIAWMPDGTLLLSVGDAGNPPVMVEGRLARLNAQDLNSHTGKGVRLARRRHRAARQPLCRPPGCERRLARRHLGP